MSITAGRTGLVASVAAMVTVAAALTGAAAPAAATAAVAGAPTAVTGATTVASAWPAHRSGSAWTINTIAGGLGGPALATRVALAGGNQQGACGASFTSGYLYIGDELFLRKVNPHTGWTTTPLGTGAPAPLADGGPAGGAALYSCGAATDHNGNLVITDIIDQRVRVVAKTTGTYYGQAMTAGDIYTVAGNGTQSYGGDGGPATSAELDVPRQAVIDHNGNIVFADEDNMRVRVVASRTGTFYQQAMTAGDIYTIAGDGGFGFSGDGGLATKAELSQPEGVLVDGSGNLVIADTGNARLRVVPLHSGTFYGMAMTARHIYTIAGNGTPCDASPGNGGPALAASLCDPESLARDAAGNLLIAEPGANRLRVIAESAGTFYGQAMTAGDIYPLAGTGTAGFAGDGGPAAAAQLHIPETVTVDSRGNVLTADAENNRVRMVAVASGTFYGQAVTAGDIYTIAGPGTRGPGDGGPATRAQLSLPQAVARDSVGNLVIADPGGERIRVVAAATGRFYGQAMTAGDVYTVAGTGNFGFSGDGGPATRAKLYNPTSIAIDSAGNLVTVVTGLPRIRVIAESSGTFYGQHMTAGDIYTVAGNGQVGFSGDGGPATSAKLWGPQAVATDAAGNLIFTNGPRVRLVAASSGTFYGQAMTAGDMYTIAGHGTRASYSGDGGPATAAGLRYSAGVAVDAHGNVIISDGQDSRVRVVAASSGTFYGQAMTAGDIYTVTGDGTEGFAGDGGPAAAAEVNQPQDVALDSAGNLLIADTFNGAIRVVAVSSGTFYGQAMTAGHIYTVAGNGQVGFAGDGGPATGAELDEPWAVTPGPNGSLLITDTIAGRIRSVTG